MDNQQINKTTITQDRNLDVENMISNLKSASYNNTQPTNAQSITKTGDIIIDEKGPGFYIDNEALQVQNQDPIESMLNDSIQQSEKIIKKLEESAQNGTLTRDEYINISSGITDKDIENERRYIEMIKKKPMQSVGIAPQKLDAVNKTTENFIKQSFQNENNTKGEIEPSTSQTENYPSSTQPQQVINNIQVNVPSGNAHDFIKNLTPEIKEKITDTTSSVVVNEVTYSDIPTATRVINAREYKKIAPIDYNPDTIERVLINSGYIGYFKGAGALEKINAIGMRYDEEGNSYPDIKTQAEFIYRHLTDTSIGKLSFQQFIENTAFYDMSSCIHAILRAGDVDDSTLSIQCNNPKHENGIFDVPYKLSTISHHEHFREKTNAYIDEIIRSRTVLEKAMEVHNRAPIMIQKCAKFNMRNEDVTMVFGCPNIAHMINYISDYEELNNQYGKNITMFIANIDRLFSKFIPKGATEPETYEVYDNFIVADKISSLTDEQINAFSQLIGKYMEEFVLDTPKYIIKGTFYCPDCNSAITDPEIDMGSIVFQKVARLGAL